MGALAIVLVFPDPLAVFVEPPAHEGGHGSEVVGGAEAADGDVALFRAETG